MSTYTFGDGSTYPLMPTDIRPESFTIKHARTTLVADARSMRRQTRSVGGVRIEMQVKFPLMPREQYSSFISFFRTLDGRAGIMAFRMPLLRNDSSYSDGSFLVGEYYNVSGDGQLVQYVGVGAGAIVDPPLRSGGTIEPHSSRLPTLRCSLNTDGPQVEYGSDNFIRYTLDLIERW